MDYPLILKNLQNLILPTNEDVLKIIEQASSILYNEPSLLSISSPTFIAGDIHGQFFDLLNIFKINGYPPSSKYVFLGDYVDRGYNSVECMLLLLVMKIMYPSSLYLLRGNHETKTLSSIYGFKEECMKKYDLIVYLSFCSVFEYMPVCAVVNKCVLAVHGGISPCLSLKDVMVADRIGEITELNDLLWGDPCDEQGFTGNPRGAGFLFGEDVTADFLSENGLKYIVRSHQLVMEGYKEMFGGKLFIVWSAPNYCYKCGNKASVMRITEGCEYEFIVFDKCDRQVVG